MKLRCPKCGHVHEEQVYRGFDFRVLYADGTTANFCGNTPGRTRREAEVEAAKRGTRVVDIRRVRYFEVWVNEALEEKWS